MNTDTSKFTLETAEGFLRKNGKTIPYSEFSSFIQMHGEYIVHEGERHRLTLWNSNTTLPANVELRMKALAIPVWQRFHPFPGEPKTFQKLEIRRIIVQCCTHGVPDPGDTLLWYCQDIEFNYRPVQFDATSAINHIRDKEDFEELVPDPRKFEKEFYGTILGRVKDSILNREKYLTQIKELHLGLLNKIVELNSAPSVEMVAATAPAGAGFPT